MKEKIVICTVCPKGCHVRAVQKDGEVSGLGGNGCKRGIDFAVSELTNPVRTLTTTVRINSSQKDLLPVRTDKPVPKSILMDIIQALSKITATPPIQSGDPIITDILNTGANIIACEDMDE
ncbi:MAG: hypothetical protein BGN88_07115 [Clostridiales bacterium 43-6]|nr:MAG: hypothetical protein BGN88_07115 [Clostridiales bacterium 43-6]